MDNGFFGSPTPGLTIEEYNRGNQLAGDLGPAIGRGAINGFGSAVATCGNPVRNTGCYVTNIGGGVGASVASQMAEWGYDVSGTNVKK